MLTTDSIRADLDERLKAAGFDAARPDLAAFWAAWSSQSLEPVQGMAEREEDAEQDKLLFESSLDLRVPPAWEYEASPPAFSLSFTRQFTLEDDDGEYDGMEGLHASFALAPLDRFRETVQFGADPERGHGATLWGWPSIDGEEWVQKVEAHPTFVAALGEPVVRWEMGFGGY